MTNKFTEDHLKLMIAIGHQAALAVEDTRYYSAMVQAERLAAIGQTIATLSHHIKNILQGIRGGSYLIEMGLKDHDDEVMRKGGPSSSGTRIASPPWSWTCSPSARTASPICRLPTSTTVVSEVIELMRVQATELKVDLDWRPCDDMPELVFDPEGIHRAVLNVVTNAIDAVSDREPPGHVEVATQYSVPERLVRITVDDNGPGIPADQMEHLFSPFVSSKKSRGTGLGLPVSQKILREHGGQIVVHSEPDRGCRFTLELPATLPQAILETVSHVAVEERGEGSEEKQKSSQSHATFGVANTRDRGGGALRQERRCDRPPPDTRRQTETDATCAAECCARASRRLPARF